MVHERPSSVSIAPAPPMPMPMEAPVVNMMGNVPLISEETMTKAMEQLRLENADLRAQADELSRKVARVGALEQEMAKIHAAYQELLRTSEKREALEKAARQKLQNVIVNLSEVNKVGSNERLSWEGDLDCVSLSQELTERHESVMTQLMTGDPKNQNIPGLDAILRGEVSRKEALIAQLMNQNKMLIAAKERQDVEMTAQHETLEVNILLMSSCRNYDIAKISHILPADYPCV
jgi:hypothetical protein